LEKGRAAARHAPSTSKAGIAARQTASLPASHVIVRRKYWEVDLRSVR